MCDEATGMKTVGALAAAIFLVTFGLFATPINAASSTDGEVAHWEFNEGAGDTLSDVTGNLVDCSIKGANWDDGIDGGALLFDGVDDYVDCPGVADLTENVFNNFTMSCWVKPLEDHEIDIESVYSQSGTSGQHYAIYPPHGEKIFSAGHSGMGISIGNNGISVYEHTSYYMPAVLVWQGNISDWTSVIVVVSDKQPSLYVNGEFVKNGLTSTKSFVHPGPGQQIYPDIEGGIGGGYWGYFNGLIDEVSVYDRPLTDVEVSDLYHDIADEDAETDEGTLCSLFIILPSIIAIPAGIILISKKMR